MDLDEKISNFMQDLKQGKLPGPYDVAYQTVLLLRKIVAHSKWHTAQELMDTIRDAGKRLMNAQPSETTVGNMVRRVLKIIRDEYSSESRESEEGGKQELIQKVLEPDGDCDDYSKKSIHLKSDIIEAIGELITELETNIDNIAVQALQHIHSDELILTAGRCPAVETFLKRAARERNFQVIVVECAPFYDGQKLAKNLAEAGIKTTLITDSAVFAMMSRVNKVIIGTHTVMANGGLKAINGSHTIALAAKKHSVPLIVCASMFMLSPEYMRSYDQNAFNKFVSPEDVLSFSEGEIISKCQIYSPVFDYVPADLVTLYITNIGGNAPSYVYRLLIELYHPDDYEL